MHRTLAFTTAVALLLVGFGCKPSAEDIARKDSCDRWPKFNGEYATCWSKKYEGCVSFLPIKEGREFQVYGNLNRKVLYESKEDFATPESREKAMQKEMKELRCL